MDREVWGRRDSGEAPSPTLLTPMGGKGGLRDLGELKTYFLLVLFSVYELIP